MENYLKQMKPIIVLVALLFSACSLAMSEPETRDGTKLERQRLRLGVAKILGIPEKSVSDTGFLRQYFFKKIEQKTPQAETREKIRSVFSEEPAGLVIDYEYTDRRDSVSISYLGKQHVFREVFDFYYNEDHRFIKVFGTLVTEPKVEPHKPTKPR